jgi:hypothetical protein
MERTRISVILEERSPEMNVLVVGGASSLSLLERLSSPSARHLKALTIILCKDSRGVGPL